MARLDWRQFNFIFARNHLRFDCSATQKKINKYKFVYTFVLFYIQAWQKQEHQLVRKGAREASGNIWSDYLAQPPITQSKSCSWQAHQCQGRWTSFQWYHQRRSSRQILRNYVVFVHRKDCTTFMREFRSSFMLVRTRSISGRRRLPKWLGM